MKFKKGDRVKVISNTGGAPIITLEEMGIITNTLEFVSSPAYKVKFE